jgi:hypothetical protein
MALITTLTLNLAPAVAKSILKFWLKDTLAEEIPRDIVDSLKKKTEDVLAQKKRQTPIRGDWRKGSRKSVATFRGGSSHL